MPPIEVRKATIQDDHCTKLRGDGKHYDTKLSSLLTSQSDVDTEKAKEIDTASSRKSGSSD